MILIKISISTRYRKIIDFSEITTMYVCLCKGITDDQIRQTVEEGATHFGQVRKTLGLASQCGKCANLAREVFNESIESTLDNDQLFYAVS